jgi:hypothetical protein
MDSSIVLNFLVGEFVSDVLTWLMTIEPPAQNFVVEFKLRYVKAILSFFPFPLKLTFSSLNYPLSLLLDGCCSLSPSKIDDDEAPSFLDNVTTLSLALSLSLSLYIYIYIYIYIHYL